MGDVVVNNEVLDTSDLRALEECLMSIVPRPSPESLSCLRRLANRKLEQNSSEKKDDAPIPPRDLTAAVIVLLHLDRSGKLLVTLTTRSKSLRSFPGQTALPGGRMEEYDTDVTVTALREANEEIGLPLDRTICPLIHLFNLPYCLSANHLYVAPIVYFLATPVDSILPYLKPNPGEVEAIFHWPLLDFLLDPRSDGKLIHSFVDVTGPLGRPFRLHDFSHNDMPSATAGLTADVLITVALIASALDEPFFEWRVLNQMDWDEIVQCALDDRVGGAEVKRVKRFKKHRSKQTK